MTIREKYSLLLYPIIPKNMFLKWNTLKYSTVTAKTYFTIPKPVSGLFYFQLFLMPLRKCLKIYQ